MFNLLFALTKNHQSNGGQEVENNRKNCAAYWIFGGPPDPGWVVQEFVFHRNSKNGASCAPWVLIPTLA